MNRRLRYLSVTIAVLWICATYSSAQLTANSLADLRNYGLTVNNETVTLSSTGGDPHPVTGIVTPGHYWINGDHISNPTNSMPIFMDLSGNGNTYDLSGATINLDTRKLDGFGRNLGHDSGVDVIQITGSNNTVQGLTLIGQDIALDTDPNAQRYADWATQYVELSGNNNTVDGANVVTRGSRTDSYGLSDAFGKGAAQGISPFIGHRKASAFRVGDATDAVVNDMHLDVNTFGHGFFVQSSTNTTLTNSTVTGEMFPSSLVTNHSLYQQHGHTWWGEPIPDDILLAGPEGGVRVYTGASGLTVDNVVVTNMRTGFATVHAGGSVNISNSYANGTTSGFDVGDNTTISNSGGNIVNGPLLVFYGSGNNTTIDLELTGGAPIGTNWSAAYFNGNADITLSSDLSPGALPQDSFVRLGQNFFENWREYDYNTANAETSSSSRGAPTPYTNSTFHNNTNQMLILGESAVGNTGSSQAPVISNGKANYYDGITLVMNASRLVLVHANGLGNGGTSADGSLDSNVSIVELGSTVEVTPGIRVEDEKLVISGNGVDGNGALYSDGSDDSNTRFGSSNSGDESTIFLAGDASIGVGVAGNQLLVGKVQGAGNLTKLGPGTLVMGKASTYAGNLHVAAGQVTARPGVVHNDLTVSSTGTVAAIGGNALDTTGEVYLDGALDLNARTDASDLSHSVGRLHGAGLINSSNSVSGADGTLNITTASGESEFSGVIQGSVSIFKTGVGTQIFSGANTYDGSTIVSDGTLLVNGSHSGTGDYLVEGGIFGNAGTLGGTGSIQGDILVNAGGTLSPGASAGVLSVGDVTFSTSSTLRIDIGGNSAGVGHGFLLAGTLMLGGDLVVSLIDDATGSLFIPAASESLVVSVATDLTGAFDNVADGERLATADGEGSFIVSYSSATDQLLLSAFHLNGDFDSNGIVDASDFTVWKDNLGQVGLTPFSGADGNGDGLVTEFDYLVWMNNFGLSTSPPVVVSVPEPSNSWVLLALAGSFMIRTASRRKQSR